MGVSAIRVIGSSVARFYGSPPADPVAGPPVVHEAAGRLFFDITTIMRSVAGRSVFPRVLDVMEARSAAVLRALSADPRLPVVYSSWWPVVRRLAWVAARFGIPFQVAQAVARPEAARRRLDRVGAKLRARRMPAAEAGAAQRLDFVVGLLSDAVVRVVPRVMPPAAAGFAMLWLAARLLGADARPGDLATVLRGLPHNVTTEMDLELWSVATAIRADEDAAAAVRGESPAALAERFRSGALTPVLQDRLRGFLDRYGHRAVAEIDLGVPRCAEDPTHVLGVLANYLRLDDPGRAPDVVFTRGAAQARSMVTTLTDRARRRSPLRARAVGLALDRARQLAGIRELPKSDLVLVLAQARRELLRIGAELTAAGRLAGAEDVFFLGLGEVAEALDGPGPARGRRAAARRPRPGDGPSPRAPRAAQRRHRAGSPVGDATGGGRCARGHSCVRRDGHRARARRARPGGRAPGTGRGPRRAVHGPWLDAALPDRGRARHGDGRAELPRGGGRTRVRHPGGRRPAGGHQEVHDGPAAPHRRDARPGHRRGSG